MQFIKGTEVAYKIASLIEDGVVEEISMIGCRVTCVINFKTSQDNIDIIRKVLYREKEDKS